jgi:hypothetical protein
LLSDLMETPFQFGIRTLVIRQSLTRSNKISSDCYRCQTMSRWTMSCSSLIRKQYLPRRDRLENSALVGMDNIKGLSSNRSTSLRLVDLQEVVVKDLELMKGKSDLLLIISFNNN